MITLINNINENSLYMYNIHKFVLLSKYITKFQFFVQANLDLKNNKYLFTLFAAYSGDLDYVIKARKDKKKKIESRRNIYTERKLSLIYVHDKLIKFDCLICNIATKGGQLNIIKWICDQDLNLKYDSIVATIFCNAAEYGHMNILIWIHQEEEDKCRHNGHAICNYAARGGQMEIIQWGLQNGYRLDTYILTGYGVYLSIFASAAEGGKLEILKWLCQQYKQDNIKDIDICLYAARKGHLEILKWLYIYENNDNNYNIIMISNMAAKNGHLHILKWCYYSEFEGYSSICASAAEGNHLNILQWLNEKKCKWDEKSCTSAAKYGNLEILKWLRNNDCSWDENTCYNAASYRHLDILKWCYENKCPIDIEICKNYVVCQKDRFKRNIIHKINRRNKFDNFDKNLFCEKIHTSKKQKKIFAQYNDVLQWLKDLENNSL